MTRSLCSNVLAACALLSLPALPVDAKDGLREMQVDSELVLYPGKGHVIEDAGNRANMLRRVVDWYDRYIKFTKTEARFHRN